MNVGVTAFRLANRIYPTQIVPFDPMRISWRGNFLFYLTEFVCPAFREHTQNAGDTNEQGKRLGTQLRNREGPYR